MLERMKIGDKVLVIGSVGQDVIQVPSETQLYMTREANVALVEVGDVPEDR